MSVSTRVFIVADKITVESRRAGVDADQACTFGSVRARVSSKSRQIHKDSRGTDIILHLREDALDYFQWHKVKQIINKYSDHISLPIEMQKEVWQQEAVEG